MKPVRYIIFVCDLSSIPVPAFFCLILCSDVVESGPLVGEADHESNDGSLLAMMRTHLAALTQTETNALNPFKYRIQLWQAVLSVSDSIEKRNRCFSSLFQRFMR